jgi:two-component system, OmpR family, sensor kinase
VSVSLKRRLIVILSLLILLTWAGSAGLTGLYSKRLLQSQMDHQLEQTMDLVVYISNVFSNQLESGAPLSAPLRPEMFGRGGAAHLPIVIDTLPSQQELPRALNIWLGDNMLAVLENSPRFAKPTENGFSYRDLDGQDGHWRILSRYDERTELWLLVGVEEGAARRDLLTTIGQALLPLLVILPLTALLLYWGVRRGLLPVQRLAYQIARRNPQVLDAVSKQGVPREVEPVVDALNRLLERLAQALEGEQRFTANAAHELMTPLAAIKTEVQLCQRQMQDERGQQMLQRIAQRVDRASHTVEQLLTLARVDPDSPLPMTRVNLRALLGEVLAELGHLAADRNLEIELSGCEDLSVSGSEEALAILLRNLLGNAFRYAIEGSCVEIRLALAQSGVQLDIENPCQPMSADEFASMVQRFYRVPGSRGLGAGLGLSIVSRIAEQHQAQFRVGPGEALHSFRATVLFSLPT